MNILRVSVYATVISTCVAMSCLSVQAFSPVRVDSSVTIDVLPLPPESGDTIPADGPGDFNSTTMPPPPYRFCGDGVVSDGETCDDGNQTDGDGCPAQCYTQDIVPAPPSCDTRQSTFCSVFGRLPVFAGFCANDCTVEEGSCGDGILQAQRGEACDLGAANGRTEVSPDGQYCTASCKIPQCSDGQDNDAETNRQASGRSDGAEMDPVSGDFAMLTDAGDSGCYVCPSCRGQTTPDENPYMPWDDSESNTSCTDQNTTTTAHTAKRWARAVLAHAGLASNIYDGVDAWLQCPMVCCGDAGAESAVCSQTFAGCSPGQQRYLGATMDHALSRCNQSCTRSKYACDLDNGSVSIFTMRPGEQLPTEYTNPDGTVRWRYRLHSALDTAGQDQMQTIRNSCPIRTICCDLRPATPAADMCLYYEQMGCANLPGHQPAGYAYSVEGFANCKTACAAARTPPSTDTGFHCCTPTSVPTCSAHEGPPGTETSFCAALAPGAVPFGSESECSAGCSAQVGYCKHPVTSRCEALYAIHLNTCPADRMFLVSPDLPGALAACERSQSEGRVCCINNPGAAPSCQTVQAAANPPGSTSCAPYSNNEERTARMMTCQQSCTATQIGQPCDVTAGCGEGMQCLFQLKPAAGYVCRPKNQGAGKECASTLECSPGLRCDPVSKTCIVPPCNKQAGESCAPSEDRCCQSPGTTTTCRPTMLDMTLRPRNYMCSTPLQGGVCGSAMDRDQNGIDDECGPGLTCQRTQYGRQCMP